MENEKKVLVTISGGGMSQIESALGIIEAIKVHDLVTFDEIWGTSAGAIVGSVLMSLDQDCRKFRDIIEHTTPGDWFKIKKWQAFKSIFSKSNYIADNTAFKEFICETLNDKSEETVKVAVTDMGKVGGDGLVAGSYMFPGTPAATIASMSFQHIFPPVIIDGRMYADGGVHNLCPIPQVTDVDKYSKIYIILESCSPLLPEVSVWPFVNKFFNLIDSTLEREISQIKEFGLDHLPNVVVFQPPSWTNTAGFLKWSDNFEQISASYNYALDVLDRKDVS